MSLNEFVNLIRKSSGYIGLFLIVVVVIITIYRFIDNPAGEQGFGNLKSPEFKNVIAKTIDLSAEPNFSLKHPRLLKVYRSPGVASSKEVASRIGFLDTPQTIGESFMWSNQLANFKVAKKTTNFTYFNTKIISARTVVEEQAEDIATDFLRKMGVIDKNLKLENIGVTYVTIKGPEFEIVDKTKEYNIFSFNFGARVENISLVSNQGSKVLYNVWVSVDGNTYKATGNLQNLAFIESSTYPTEKLSNLGKEINQNKFAIVNLTTDINVPRYSSNNNVSVVFEKAEVVYYLPAEKIDFLQPILLLEGRQKSSTNNLFFALKTVLKSEVLD